MKIITKTKNDLQDIAGPPKKGETIEGKIIGNSHFAVYVDLGARGTGIIYGKEYYLAKDTLRHIKPGGSIKAKIVTIDNEDGYLELSLREAQQEIGWENLKEMEGASATVTVDIAGANKGGLLAELEGIRGFLPLSQLSIKHYPRVKNGETAEILKNLQELVGQKLNVKIIDVNSQENKLIFSEKAVTSREINQLLQNYKPGDIVEGKITGLAEFGAFMKFPLPTSDVEEKTLQAEGLIHISELDWQLIDDVSEIVKIGDIVKAKITDISQDGKVSLSLKALKQDPWKGVEEKYKKGDIIEGKVVKISQLGAFVEVAPKIRGLAHVAQADSQIQGKNTLVKGEQYKFEITALDEITHKMGLKHV